VIQTSKPSAPRGHRHPIDSFFHSLAEDQGERAIAIILSGTGTNGSLGLRFIKSEGGVVIAQDPETAAFDGMPRSAIIDPAAAHQPSRWASWSASGIPSPVVVATSRSLAWL
jgi:two-component system CheB/CheR fusion protein